jgi:hypothetical protein
LQLLEQIRRKIAIGRQILFENSIPCWGKGSGEEEEPFLLTPESFDEKPGPDREACYQKKNNKFHSGKGYT